MSEIKGGNIKEPVSYEAMGRLLKLMNNTPTKKKLAGTEFELKPLKNGVMWLIAEEAHKLEGIDKATTENILLNMARSLPIMVRVITLAILNDKERIEKEYDTMFDTIMWETTHREFDTLFLDILNMMDMQFFFANIKQVTTFLQKVGERKMTTAEQKSLLQGQH